MLKISLSLSLCCAIFVSVAAQDMVHAEFKGHVSAEDLAQQFSGVVPIAYGIDMYKVTYTTPDPFGQLDTASGLLIVPDAGLVQIFPLLVFQHGTVDNAQEVPSNLSGGHQLGQATGGLGYVTLMPDYLGAGESRGFHPYVHAATEASASLDMIRAVKEYAPTADILLNDQLFISGYSQGGHASMALHREIELLHSDELSVTAASHMSGPYSISGEMTKLILSDDPYYFAAYLPNTFLSYNYVYGLYETTEAVFKATYAPMIDAFRDGEIGLGELNNFLIDELTSAHGAPIVKHLLQDSIVDILASSIDHPLHQALADNDVYDWAPLAPTRIVYCTADDQVVYTNSIIADTTMNNLGSPDVEAIDVGPNSNHSQCVFPASLTTVNFFAEFQSITTNVTEIDGRKGAIFYPNPSKDYLFLKDHEGAADIIVSDLNGRILLRGQTREGEGFAIHTLRAGVYLVRARMGARELVGRLVIP